MKPEQSISIDDSFNLTDIPIAEKSDWLIRHIKKVISDNPKLYYVATKVACITPSMISTFSFSSRLKLDNDIAEVCTPHEFLYKNIVKPYIKHVMEDFSDKHVINNLSDEILEISRTLFSKYSNIYNLIRRGYPYVFVDDFENVDSFTVDLLNGLKKAGVVVGTVSYKI